MYEINYKDNFGLPYSDLNIKINLIRQPYRKKDESWPQVQRNKIENGKPDFNLLIFHILQHGKLSPYICIRYT